MTLAKKRKYAEGIVSFQIGVNYKGRDCHVLIQDPRTPWGMSWVGGFIPPRGSFYEVAERIIAFQTGAKIKTETLRLKKVLYSQSALGGRWLANHNFRVETYPLDQWSQPECTNIKVALYDTESFARFPGSPPEKIVDHYGQVNNQFAWSINDGGYLGLRVAHSKRYKAENGIEPLQNIPFVNVLLPRASDLPSGVALNVASIILPHDFKGKRGRVVIKNRDSEYYANIGGKVEIPSTSPYNTNVIGAAIAEAGEELGIPLHPQSIVGVALTPFDLVITDRPQTIRKIHGDTNSVINTCLRVTPARPKDLENLLNKGPQAAVPKSEREKIEGIYFLPDDEYLAMLNMGKMRTLDMIPLARQEMQGVAAQRVTLEHVATLPKDLYAATLHNKIESDGHCETTPVPA